MTDILKDYLDYYEQDHGTNTDLGSTLLWLVVKAINIVPALTAQCASFLDTDDAGMNLLISQYIKFFLGGAVHGLIAFWFDGSSVVSHLFEVYSSDFLWVFDRALDIVCFIRREGPISESSDWAYAFESLLAWAVVFTGYFSSATTLRICHIAISFEIWCFDRLGEILSPVVFYGVCWMFILGLVVSFTVPRITEAISRLVYFACGLVLRNLVLPSIKLFIVLVNSSSRSNWSTLESYSIPRKCYSYSDHKLGERQIRLLRIRRRSLSGLVECEIFPVSLEDAKGKHSFQAISYTWGTGTEMKAISLNSCRFDVTSSVYELLDDRRSWVNSPVIWIDSICINQKDNQDKSSQVVLMRQIYERASNVLVWLGNAPDAGLAIKQIVEINFQLTASIKVTAADKILEKLWTAQRSSLFSDPHINAFVTLLSHPYWERVWIVQEVVAASQVSIFYGGYYITWNDFLRVVDYFNDPKRGEKMLTLSTIRPAQSGEVAPLLGLILAPRMETTRAHYAAGKRSPLWHLLQRHIVYKATNPRDKVYALQGISENPHALTINYDQDVSSVYTDAARYFLGQGTLADILHYAGIGWNYAQSQKDLILPSWVPNWSQLPARAMLSSSGANYNASAGYPPFMMEMYGDNTLNIGGYLVDEIEYLTSPFPPEDKHRNETGLSKDEDLYRNALGFYNDAVKIAMMRANDPYPYTSQPLHEAFWRTLVCDRLGSVRPAPASMGKDIQFCLKFAANRQTYLSEYLQQAPKQAGSSDVQNLIKLTSEGHLKNKLMNIRDPLTQRKIMEVMASLVCFTFDRRFAVTKKGYLAIVPPQSKRGDVVGIVMGAKTPFIFRLLEEGNPPGFRRRDALVGECYVHGIMDGEVLQSPTKEMVDFEVY